jgi:L-serine dehydratase
MAISVFDLFKVGIGPSSSHTTGPMRAAHMFVDRLTEAGALGATTTVVTDLYGSLGATGRGHGSDRAVLLGLSGYAPETVDPAAVEGIVAQIRSSKSMMLGGSHRIDYDEPHDLLFHRKESLPFHPNGMRLVAKDASGSVLLEKVYYSVGGGFVVDPDSGHLVEDTAEVAHPFRTGDELLAQCEENGLLPSEVMLANELSWRTAAEVHDGLLAIWHVMQDCVTAGCNTTGVLPGRLGVRRRAAELHATLTSAGSYDPMVIMDWVNLFALAVNEENAAGGRVVTAPTNGAAGIIPAVLHYYTRFVPGADDDKVVRFLLTAGAIGLIYKETASISGAEVGCQGEVGSACSMAAGALAEVLGGTPAQIENAAEIAMEHNLGLTCDPIGGLVQVPCIERNAIAAVKAINAARLAIRGDGQHHVSLDDVVRTMRETGADMNTKYKETARGGLAVNVIEC